MTISPYIAHAARRASTQITCAPILAVTHEFPHRYAREITDGISLENSGPAIEPAWVSWLAGALTLFAIIVVWVVL